MALARELQSTAERAGVLRATAFATALLGEAALLAGDLDVAERELQEAADLAPRHRIERRRGTSPCSGWPRCGWPRAARTEANRLLAAGPAAGPLVARSRRTSSSASTGR